MAYYNQQKMRRDNFRPSHEDDIIWNSHKASGFTPLEDINCETPETYSLFSPKDRALGKMKISLMHHF